MVLSDGSGPETRNRCEVHINHFSGVRVPLTVVRFRLAEPRREGMSKIGAKIDAAPLRGDSVSFPFGSWIPPCCDLSNTESLDEDSTREF